jgi:quercetin dioxygenase-like cupin family protein
MSLTDKQLSDAGIDVEHHFGGGVYAKDTRIPAGTKLEQHAHPFDHLSILAYGTAAVEADGVRQVVAGPRALLIKAGTVHSVEAITDVVWFCIHATDETDPSKVDDVILKG